MVGILPALFDPVYVPEQVMLELDMGRLLRRDTINPRDLTWVVPVSVSEEMIDGLPPNRLGAGERAVIAYARAYDNYIADIQGEVVAGGLTWSDVNIHPPVLPPNVVQGEPITVTIDYTMTTAFSEIVLPMFGRFGMPTEYHIRAWTSVPIR